MMAPGKSWVFFDDKSKSDFESFACPLSPGAKSPSDERVFVV